MGIPRGNKHRNSNTAYFHDTQNCDIPDSTISTSTVYEFKAFGSSTAPLFRECFIMLPVIKHSLNSCPLFSQHVLGQTIQRYTLAKWPTVGMAVSSRRRKSLLRKGCTPTPFSRRHDWRCTIPSARSAPCNC